MTIFRDSYFDEICLPLQLQKKVWKMPNFENGTALSWVSPDSALKVSYLAKTQVLPIAFAQVPTISKLYFCPRH